MDIYIHAPYVINVATSNNRIRIPSRKLLDQQLKAAASVGVGTAWNPGTDANTGTVPANVSDVEASVTFYEKAFGVTVTKRRPGYAKFDLQSPALNLTMAEAPEHPHMAARKVFVSRHGVTQPAPAPRFSRTPSAIREPAMAEIGQLTSEWKAGK